MNRTPMSQSYVNSQAGQEQQQGQAGQQQQQASGSSQAGPPTSAGQSQNSNFPMMTEQMPQLMCATELTNLLLEFAFSVFVNKPQDIVDYAAQYFQQLQAQRAGGLSNPSPAQQPSNSNNNNSSTSSTAYSNNNKRASSDSQRSNLSQNSIIDNDDNFDCEPARPGQVNFSANSGAGGQPKLSFNRRKSVFAEQYDPANDQEDDENNRVVHSKTDEQRSRLAKAIKSIFIFRSVDPIDMSNILDAMFEVKVKAGDVVIRQGDDGDNFYVVENGKFQIYVAQADPATGQELNKQIRGEYENNGSFGELALMYNQPRAATVVALTDGSLWAMDRNTFRRIVLKRAFKKRKEYEALFEKVSVLQCLNGYERMNLCDALESKRFLNGQMIIVQGDQANGMYFIESGNVKIVKQREDGRVDEVAILGKGDYFGELALINHKPRAASVYATGDDVKLAFLDVKAFERLLGSCIERMEKNCAIYLNELTHNDGRQNV